MAYNSNWDRWTLASIAAFLHATFRDDNSVNWSVYVLGADLGEETDYVDPSKSARLAANVITVKRQVTKSEFWLDVDVTLILTTTQSAGDAFNHSRSVGVLESKIPSCLPLLKKGDSDEEFCSLVLESPLKPVTYPSVGQTTRVSQTVYELAYKGQIDGTD